MKFLANYLVVRKLICIFASKMNNYDILESVSKNHRGQVHWFTLSGR